MPDIPSPPKPLLKTKAYLSFGSNEGDRAAFVITAMKQLTALPDIDFVETSCLYETEPVDLQDNLLDEDASPLWFINAVMAIKTSKTPEQLLADCLHIEKNLGRSRRTDLGSPSAPTLMLSRCIDIDILLFGSEICNTPNLTIPHLKLHQRAFVLVPLLEIAADVRHPKFNRSIAELHQALTEPEDVKLFIPNRSESLQHSEG